MDMCLFNDYEASQRSVKNPVAPLNTLAHFRKHIPSGAQRFFNPCGVRPNTLRPVILPSGLALHNLRYRICPYLRVKAIFPEELRHVVRMHDLLAIAVNTEDVRGFIELLRLGENSLNGLP